VSVGVACVLHDLPALKRITIMLAESAFKNERERLVQVRMVADHRARSHISEHDSLEWHTLIYERGLTISTNLFGTTFYSLVGLPREPRHRWAVLFMLVFISV